MAKFKLCVAPGTRKDFLYAVYKQGGVTKAVQVAFEQIKDSDPIKKANPNAQYKIKKIGKSFDVVIKNNCAGVIVPEYSVPKGTNTYMSSNDVKVLKANAAGLNRTEARLAKNSDNKSITRKYVVVHNVHPATHAQSPYEKKYAMTQRVYDNGKVRTEFEPLGMLFDVKDINTDRLKKLLARVSTKPIERLETFEV